MIRHKPHRFFFSLMAIIFCCPSLISQQNFQTGYSFVVPKLAEDAPGATAFRYRDADGILIWETEIGVTKPTVSGTFFVTAGDSWTAFAVVNVEKSQNALNWILRDSSGREIGQLQTILEPGQHKAVYVHQAISRHTGGLHRQSLFSGTGEVGAAAVRQDTNRFDEIIFTALPITDLAAEHTSEPKLLPQIGVGAVEDVEVTTQLLLTNPTEQIIAGRLSFFETESQSTEVVTEQKLTSEVPYTLLPYGVSVYDLKSRDTLQYGYAIVNPDNETVCPEAVALLQFRRTGRLMSQVGIGTAEPVQKVRMPIRQSGDRSAITITSVENIETDVMLRVLNVFGRELEVIHWIVPAGGQLSAFLEDWSTSMGEDFQGIVELEVDNPVALAALTLTVNIRDDLIAAALPILNLGGDENADSLLLPHIAFGEDGGGTWSTDKVLLNRSLEHSVAGTITVLGEDGSGEPVPLGGGYGDAFNYQLGTGSVSIYDSQDTPSPAIENITPPALSSAGGELVTIVGSHFSPDCVVLIDEQQYEVQFVSSEVVTFTTRRLDVGLTTLTVEAVGKKCQVPISIDTVPVNELNPGEITTVAGGYRYSGDGGDAASATFGYPRMLATDKVGNLFIADMWDYRIRRVDAGTGIINTTAGTGMAGWTGDGGFAAKAGVNYPRGISVDSIGNLYFTDWENRRVRRIDLATGMISNFAGTGNKCPGCEPEEKVDGRCPCDFGDGGPATEGIVVHPSAVAASPNGDVYIADWQTHRVRKVDGITGTITTIAGTGEGCHHCFSWEEPVNGRCPCDIGDGGPATGAILWTPDALAVDAEGNLFVYAGAERSKDGPDFDRIRRVDAVSGIITTFAGGGDPVLGAEDGIHATESFLKGINQMTFDAEGNLYLVESERVRMIEAATGIITTVAEGFDHSRGVTVGPGGEVYIGEIRSIFRFEPDTGNLAPTAGTGLRPTSGDGGPAVSAYLRYPRAVTIDPSGNIYFLESRKVRKVDAGDGSISTLEGVTCNAYDIASDSQGDLSLYDSCGSSTAGSAITKYDISTGMTQVIVEAGGSFALDGKGNLLFSESHQIKRISLETGTIEVIAGTGEDTYSGDGGPALQAGLASTAGLTVDQSSNILFVDSRRIRRIDSETSIITTVAGNGEWGFSGDGGPATNASFIPADIAVDNSGNLYISDYHSHRIQRVDLGSGIITTLAGNGACHNRGDGLLATDAHVCNPRGLAVDSEGNLYIADMGGLIRVVRRPIN